MSNVTTAPEFLGAVQCKVARTATTAAATRGRGRRGAGKSARDFLSALDLNRFSTTSRAVFRQQLDDVTDELNAVLPVSSRSWGLARKLINIFLRGVLYTTYLNEKLSTAEEFLEIPLDSITGGRLYDAARGVLPRWRGVKYLEPAVSEQYQRQAEQVAHESDLFRVHLDTYWWGGRQQVPTAAHH